MFASKLEMEGKISVPISLQNKILMLNFNTLQSTEKSKYRVNVLMSFTKDFIIDALRLETNIANRQALALAYIHQEVDLDTKYKTKVLLQTLTPRQIVGQGMTFIPSRKVEA